MEPALKAAIHRRLGNTFVLGIVYRENISRGTSGKYEDFRCEFAE